MTPRPISTGQARCEYGFHGSLFLSLGPIHGGGIITTALQKMRRPAVHEVREFVGNGQPSGRARQECQETPNWGGGYRLTVARFSEHQQRQQARASVKSTLRRSISVSRVRPPCGSSRNDEALRIGAALRQRRRAVTSVEIKRERGCVGLSEIGVGASVRVAMVAGAAVGAPVIVAAGAEKGFPARAGESPKATEAG